MPSGSPRLPAGSPPTTVARDSARPRGVAPPSGPAERAEILAAFADLLASGRTPVEALAPILGLGGAAGLWATRLAAGLRRGVAVAAALAESESMSAEEAAYLARADALGRLPFALRVVVDQRVARRELWREVRRASLGPLSILGLTLLALPLPGLALGGGYLRPLVAAAGPLVVAAVVLATLLPRLLRSRAVGANLLPVGERVPLVAGLLRQAAEARFAGALSALVGGEGVTHEALGAASLIVPPGALARTLASTAARGRDGAASGPASLRGVVSESLALVLLDGRDPPALAARLARFRDDAASTIAARVRLAARALLWGLVLVVSLQGAAALLSRPLPGLGGPGRLDGSLEELDRLLDSSK